MIKPSSEVRWFLKERLSNNILDWFCHGSPFKLEQLGQEPRTDRYLVFPGCKSLGVKFREGKLEIKVLKAAPEPVHYSSGVTGLAAIWEKWTCIKPAVENLQKELSSEEKNWLEIGKERWLRKFSLDKIVIEEVEPNPPDGSKLPDRGCNIEITRINTLNSGWWSLAFESFGDLSGVRENLCRTAENFFWNSRPPVILTTGNSWSYPAWLATHMP